MNPKDLGIFIRKHRERLQPADAGLRATGRRRTPGLRREELAQLCQVSPTWITWLEQGRPVTASDSMLDRLSDALRLDSAERRYLFALAGRTEAEGERQEGRDAVLESVKFMNSPAYVLDRLWNALSWNGEAEALFSGWLDGEEKNLLKFVFLSPVAKKLIGDRADRGRRLVAEFRADCGPRLDDADVADLVAELSASSLEFAKYWADWDVTEREGGLREFDHEKLGRLAFQQITFRPALMRDLKLVLLLPARPFHA